MKILSNMETILGLFATYAWVHFIVLSFTKKWADRTSYEQVISVMAIGLFVLFVLGSM